MQLPEKSLNVKATNKEIDVLKAQLVMELRNKKRCAYSSFECTQLTLDGFKYCLKHILQDKQAPYKQCCYTYASNGKRCQAAAPKIEKKDVGYCHEHAVKAALAKNRQNTRYPPPQTAEVLLYSLGHFVRKSRNRTVSESTDESEKTPDNGLEPKTTRSLDPFREIDSAINSSKILDLCSESDSDVEASSFTTVWHDAQNDSSDNESLDSDYDDPLKHASVYSAEEITTIARDKLLNLQTLYVDQYRHLTHMFKESRRKYIHNLKREKETCCNIYNQIRENPKEQRLYKKLKVLNKYHTNNGHEAILNKRMQEARAKITDGLVSKPTSFSKCMFTEGGVKCGERTLPLARHCRKHILEDPNQVLFRPCGTMKGEMECKTPIESLFEDSCCHLHSEIPAIKSYSQLRKNSESDFDDSYESPENLFMETVPDSITNEMIDYNPETDDMKTLPSVLFEESSTSLNEDKMEEEDIHVDDERSPDMEKLEIDFHDEDTTEQREDSVSSKHDETSQESHDIHKD